MPNLGKMDGNAPMTPDEDDALRATLRRHEQSMHDHARAKIAARTARRDALKAATATRRPTLVPFDVTKPIVVEVDVNARPLR